MANQKVPQLPVLSAVTGEDLFYVVDVSDTTDDPTGSSKQINRDDILKNVNTVDFNVTATTTSQVGRMRWNDADEVGTLEIGLKGGNVALQVGEENLVRVYNADSITLTAGTVVYVFGSQGNTISVKRASASGETTSSRTLGVVRESIVAGDRGFVSVGGLVHGLDTSAYSGGTPLWLSTTLGQITNIPPEAPNHIVLLGFVSRVSATVGSVFVHINNGWELDELHNVLISGVTNGDLLVYNSGTTAWENTKTLNGNYRINGTLTATTISATTYYGSGTNLTGVVNGSGTANYLPRWTGTTGLGNSQIRDDGTNIGVGTAPSTNSKIQLLTTTNQYGVWFQNANAATGSVGIFGQSNSTLGSQTGVRGEGQGHPTSGTSVGLEGWGTDGLVAIGVRGIVGASEFGSVTTGIGGYFDSRGSGEYGFPTISYGVQIIDGTEGVDKILQSKTSDGKSNWVDPLTVQTAFNYGLANAIMTGNFLT